MIVSAKEVPIRLPVSHGRSRGHHLSGIIRAIALQLKILAPGSGDGFTKMAAGLAWEEWVIPRLHQNILKHPGEFLKDGIYMSPDGLSIDDDGEVRVHEFKFTWKSAAKQTDQEWMWMAQAKAYCLAAGTNRASMHVYYVNGDYRNSGPIYRIEDHIFSNRELEENWRTILRGREFADPE